MRISDGYKSFHENKCHKKLKGKKNSEYKDKKSMKTIG
jgi:hypothetical protein